MNEKQTKKVGALIAKSLLKGFDFSTMITEIEKATVEALNGQLEGCDEMNWKRGE